MSKLNLSKATETDIASALNEIRAEGVSLQWNRRELIANLSTAKKWTDAQLKDGAAKDFLDGVGKSASQLSELRNYALSAVRGIVEDIKSESTELAASETFAKVPAANIAGLIVTQIKNGKPLSEAITKVTADKAVKNAQAVKEKTDPEEWLKSALKAFEAGLKRKFTPESVAKALAHMTELEVKAAKVEEAPVTLEATPESDAPDIASIMATFGCDEAKATMMAALMTK